MKPEERETLLYTAARYLGFMGKSLPAEQLQLMEAALDEVIAHSDFRVQYRIFSLQIQTGALSIAELELLLPGQDLALYLQGCEQLLVSFCTLGLSLERHLKRLKYLNLPSAVRQDGVASAYLEYCMDEYEKQLSLPPHTFRFAPGYGDIPFCLNQPLAQALQIEKTGAAFSGGLFIPQKSMLGMMGLGQSLVQRRCGHCARLASCIFRKNHLRCYHT